MKLDAGSKGTRPFTIWGWDLYFVTFAAVVAVFVAIAVYWLFFTNLPLPRHCGIRGGSACGWIDRGAGRPMAFPSKDGTS